MIKESNIFDICRQCGIGMKDVFRGKNEERFLENLKLEFDRLFYGPGKHCSPYESVYREGEGTLWGETTVQVKKFIEALGVKYADNWHGLPDHIGVEMELMQKLSYYEMNAWIAGDEKKALQCLKVEKKFIEEHLVRWVPVFCDSLIKEADSPFYKTIAVLTKEFVLFESRNIVSLMRDEKKAYVLT